jgi:pimeloyl-ACP methyl ester carboxylesterase
MSNPPVPDVIRACVVVGALDTPFETAGRGPTVVVLTDQPSVRQRLLSQLPRSLRIVAPTLVPGSPSSAAAATDFTEWLGGVLDALGIPSVAIVADAWLQGPAVAYAMLEPARVARLALLQTGRPDPSLVRAALTERLDSGVTVLATWLDDSVDQRAGAGVLQSLIEFLHGASRR